MERFYQNHLEAVPATASWVNPNEYPIRYMLPTEPLNDIRSMHYGGADHNHTHFSYGLMPVGNTINTCQSYSHGAANILPYGLQFQPMFHRNPTRFQYDMAVANNSYSGGGPAAKNFRGQLIHTGTVHNQDMLNGSSLPVVQGSLQQSIAKVDDGISSEVVNGGVRYINEDPSKGGFEGFVASPNHFGLSQTVLPVKNKARGPEMSLSTTSGRNIPNHWSSSQRKHGYNNRLRTNPSYPTKVSGVSSSTLRAWRSPNRAKQSGQQDKNQCGKSTHSITDPSPPSKSENQKASAPRKVWRKKTEAQAQATQPSSSQSKRSRKHTTPVYHITWDGFDEPREPVGRNCKICREDLSHSLTDDEFEYYDGLDEPSILPEVAVLPCGHTFHSQCLQFITPEEQSRDPPCYSCSNGNS